MGNLTRKVVLNGDRIQTWNTLFTSTLGLISTTFANKIKCHSKKIEE